eukprot:CAMPEP_0172531300 /NCGR_PEP_ID=MMETSP1067-20121228/4770_1 /TAXON_ID=265564 ORGANISM="Thalassiosira punctigera, Strain Tpunct2005C2" /NCGR_SAMPLE_ID=MMETSP1067 /ASSEMBLY_ACC=CAM_ASM_000444 /LENGTH=47 /DNA_ID= /DNA_START= /DNA_END= /DNA_ORIENTATION=
MNPRTLLLTTSILLSGGGALAFTAPALSTNGCARPCADSSTATQMTS